MNASAGRRSAAFGMACGSIARFPLLDLDSRCLQQIVRHVHRSTRLQLLRTCRMLRDLVLSAPTGAELLISLDDSDPAACTAARAALRRASQKECCKELAVRLSVGDPRRAAAGTLATAALFDSPSRMDGITKVVLMGVLLDRLVPTYLAHNCPNMRVLHLKACSASCAWSSMAAQLPDCPNLSELVLDGTDVSTQPKEAIKLQLSKLRGLSSLSSDTCADYIDALTVLKTRLTALRCADLDWLLELNGTWPAGRIAQQLGFLADGCTGISRIVFERLDVHAAGLEQLLRLPNVTELTVRGFSLANQDFSDRPCSWRRIYMRDLWLKVIAWLPLNSVQHIGLYSPDGYCSVHCAVARTSEIGPLVAKLGRCGGVHCDRAIEVLVDSDKNPTKLAPLLPILRSLPCRLDTVDMHITPALVQAMGRHLTDPGLQQLSFSSCTWHPLVFGILLATLPAVPIVQLRDMGVSGRPSMLSKAQLLEVCRGAVRPITLMIKGDHPGWTVQEINRALLLAGDRPILVMELA